eukprot:1795780-Pyramimonas_sp.AAC.1
MRLVADAGALRSVGDRVEAHGHSPGRAAEKRNDPRQHVALNGAALRQAHWVVQVAVEQAQQQLHRGSIL